MFRPIPSDLYAEPWKWALFLDIDGTLIDVAPEPELISIPAELPGLLQNLDAHLGGALALNTGRQLAIVDRMLAPLRFSAAGVHGTELRVDPHVDPISMAPSLPEALVNEVTARAAALSETIIVEDKRVGLAVHFRHAPETEATLCRQLLQIAIDWPAFELRTGRKVLEIIPRGLTKASAIQHFMSEPPFKGRLPIVVGDDVGDEPALTLARSMGGAALTVAGEHFARASATFTDTASVRAWLTQALRAPANESTILSSHA